MAIEVWKALSPCRPWTLGVANQVCSVQGVGLCDPLLRSSINALMPFTYDTCFRTWNVAAPTANITLPAGQTRTLFAAGIGEPLDGGWMLKGTSFTDTDRGGAPRARPYYFLVTGIAVMVQKPCTRGGDGTSADDPMLYPAWLGQGDDAEGYGSMLQNYHISYDAIQIAFGDQGQTYRAGLIGHHPAWGFAAGQHALRNGLTDMAGNYLPLNVALVVGPRDDITDMRMTVTNTQAAEIEDVGDSTEAGDVFVPELFMLIGYVVCLPYQDFCGVVQLSPADQVVMSERYGIVATPG